MVSDCEAGDAPFCRATKLAEVALIVNAPLGTLGPPPPPLPPLPPPPQPVSVHSSTHAATANPAPRMAHSLLFVADSSRVSHLAISNEMCECNKPLPDSVHERTATQQHSVLEAEDWSTQGWMRFADRLRPSCLRQRFSLLTARPTRTSHGNYHWRRTKRVAILDRRASSTTGNAFHAG